MLVARRLDSRVTGLWRRFPRRGIWWLSVEALIISPVIEQTCGLDIWPVGHCE